MIKLCWACQTEGAELTAITLLQAVSETTSDLIYAKDAEGRLLFANRATLRVLGKPVSEVLRRTELEYHPDKAQAAAIRANDRRVMDSGNEEEIEEVFTGAKGERIYLSRKTPLRDPSGKVIGIVGISSDITERKRAEAALQASEERLRRLLTERERILETERKSKADLQKAGELKDQFLAMVSHELRTPLTAILAWAYLLSSGKCPDSEKEQIYRGLLSNAQVQCQIVNDLLDMSRIAAGEMRILPRIHRVAGAIDAALNSVRISAEEKQIHIETRGPETLHVYADPLRLQQILRNLLCNAVKFSQAGARVFVEFAAEGDDFRLSVRDQGSGIVSEFLPFVFDWFRQADSSTTRPHNGLGLGLALVKTLVEMHGGNVIASSDGLGKGAVFTVTLPFAVADSSQDRDRAGVPGVSSISTGGGASRLAPPPFSQGERRVVGA